MSGLALERASKLFYQIRLSDALLLCAVFFVPWTVFRVAGLKGSELIVILAIALKLTEGWRLSLEFKTVSFAVSMIVAIVLSGVISLIDPINTFVTGAENGVYYSFELGWCFRIVRIVILAAFALMTIDFLQTNESGGMLLLVAFISSNVLIGLYFIIVTMTTIGIPQIGVVRNAFFSIEPSEAGFINCSAIILCAVILLKTRRALPALSLIILVFSQLLIGNTASLIALLVSLFVGLVVWQYHTKSGTIRRIVIVGLFCMFVGIAVIILCMYTNLFEKVINWRQYTNVAGSSVAERITTIETCFRIWLERPLFGVGLGNFGWYVSHYVTSSFLIFEPGGAFQPNNLYAELLAELGLLGISVYLYAVFSRGFSIVKHIGESGSEAWFPCMLLIVLVFLLIENLTLTTLFSFQFWLFLGMFDWWQMSKNRSEMEAVLVDSC